MRRQSSLATLATATRRSAAIAGVLRSVNATTTTTACGRGGIATMLATSPTTSARRGVATDFSHYPRDVGIVALDVYFPSTYVSQTDLGTHSIILIFALIFFFSIFSLSIFYLIFFWWNMLPETC
jgi:hypothetical protein